MGRCSGEILKPETSSIAVFTKLFTGCFCEAVKSVKGPKMEWIIAS